RFAPATGSRDTTIVHLSNFRAVKRSADAVRAFYLIRRKIPATLMMIGDGPEKEGVRELAGRLGILPDVLFVAEDPDVETDMRIAGVGLSTRDFEGFGMGVLEAMACGVRVVGSDWGGVAEVVSESCGRIAAVGDVEALAAAAVDILREPDLARSMGEAGRRR